MVPGLLGESGARLIGGEPLEAIERTDVPGEPGDVGEAAQGGQPGRREQPQRRSLLVPTNLCCGDAAAEELKGEKWVDFREW